jgi:hypothetical protein
MLGPIKPRVNDATFNFSPKIYHFKNKDMNI